MAVDRRKIPARRTAWVALAVWTLLVVVSAAWNTGQTRETSRTLALNEARTYYTLNLYYRRWGARMGGLYASAANVEPNPYLHVPHRDVATTAGTRLTLINPAYMTRMVFDLIRREGQTPVLNKLTSLKSVNPTNLPDEWEARNLKAFETGLTEAAELTEIGGESYLRLLRPFVVEEGCLTCHDNQGYHKGDIRGGISIAVPLQPFLAGEAATVRLILLTHALLWLAVGGGIVLAARRLGRGEARLAESEWKFRTLSEYSNDWEYWISREGRLVHMAPACRDVTGYAAEEFHERPGLISEVVHPDDRAHWEAHLSDAEAPEHEDFEMRIVAKDGQPRWVSHRCGPMYQRGEFIGRRVSNHDITERARLEVQLRQAQKMEAIGTLAGGIAHDFNNILTAIIGYGSLMQMKLREGDPLKDTAEQILLAAEKAALLTSGLLAFSRKQVLNPRPMALNAVVRAVEKLLGRIIGEDVALTMKLAEEDLTVFADPVQIDQVLMNLATNARDAMPGGGTLAIATERLVIGSDSSGWEGEGLRPGAYALLTVKDTGCGMDAATRAKLFGPFFTTKEAGRGTGLGLAIVYGIVSQHRGAIRVESAPGRGTTFRICLPLVTPAAAPDAAAVAPPIPRGSETILLVEDDGTVRALLKAALQDFGYTVLEATDGFEACARFEAEKEGIDLVLSDVIMPRMNGRDALEAMRKIRPGIKSLLMSGYDAESVRAWKTGDPDERFISKPVTLADLLRTVREILDAPARS